MFRLTPMVVSSVLMTRLQISLNTFAINRKEICGKKLLSPLLFTINYFEIFCLKKHGSQIYLFFKIFKMKKSESSIFEMFINHNLTPLVKNLNTWHIHLQKIFKPIKRINKFLRIHVQICIH